MNGFWLKEESCFLIRNWIVPGGIVKSLNRLLRETCKTLAQEKSTGSEFRKHMLAWGQGLTGRPLKWFSSCDLRLKCHPRRWGSGRCPHPWSWKLAVLTGKWKCYDSEMFVFDLHGFTDQNPAGLFQILSGKSGCPSTGNMTTGAFSQFLSHVNMRVMEWGKHAAHTYAYKVQLRWFNRKSPWSDRT